MATLFPLIDVPEPQETATGDTSRLYREIKWDDQTNRPVWRGGNPVWVTGAAAVKSWILMTLYTVRQSKDIFSPDYGCDLANLVGQPFSDTVRQSAGCSFQFSNSRIQSRRAFFQLGKLGLGFRTSKSGCQLIYRFICADQIICAGLQFKQSFKKCLNIRWTLFHCVLSV